MAEGTARKIRWRKVAFGAMLLEKCGLCRCRTLTRHQVLVFLLMSFGYATYVLARRPISVVKAILCPVCADSLSCNGSANASSSYAGNFSAEDFGWAPFNDIDRGRTLLGSLDLAFLFSYAVGHFISGWIAERVSLRYFLTIGMIATGTNAMLIGLAYFADIHHLAYFIVFQILGGLAQSTGWPGVVAVMTTWFGKANRGLVFGAYSICQSVGSLLGVLIPSAWAGELTSPWGWAFVVPGLISISMGGLVWLFLVEDPTHVGLTPPVQHLEEDLKKPRGSPTHSKNPLFTVFKPPATVRQSENRRNSISKDDFQSESENGKVSSSGEPISTAGTFSVKPEVYALFRRRSCDMQPESCDTELKGDAKSCDHGTSDADLSDKSHDTDVATTLSSDEVSASVSSSETITDQKPINFFRALLIPGVLEYSFAFFFIKMVSYTFLYWLPFYVKTSHPELSAQRAAWLSILYDVGGMIAVVVGGVLSDVIRSRAVVIVSALLLAIPTMFSLNAFGGLHLALYSVLLVLCGAFIVTPYTMVSTTVSSDLGTHRSLQDSQSAKATVAAIVNGIGSFGSALGPLVIGIIADRVSCEGNQNWTGAFYLLMASCLAAALLLSRLLFMDGRKLWKRLKRSFCKSSEAVTLRYEGREEGGGGGGGGGGEEEYNDDMKDYMQVMSMETTV